VSTCFSVFAGGGRREIGVDTHPQYRRRGFATLVTSAFISQCLRDGVEPMWECWADNAPSVELAKKLGFERVRDYPVYFLDLEPEGGH
jgi:predicted GNAT family acetyltransferase